MLPSENPWPVVIFCLICAVGLLIAWFQTRKKWLLFTLIVPLLLAVGAWEVDQLIVTDREMVTENVYGIVTAFQHRELEKTLSYISNSARDLKLLAASAYNMVELGPDTRVADVKVEMLSGNQRAVTVFRVNSTLKFAGGVSRVATMWEARWQPEQGDWKMIDILQRDPVSGKPEPIPDEWRRSLHSMYPQRN